MKELNELFNKLSISKVNLAKYLGVSRQMIYNYLNMDSINNWPDDKKSLIFKLLNIKDVKDLDNIVIDDKLVEHVNKLLDVNNDSAKINLKHSNFNEREQVGINSLIDSLNALKQEINDFSVVLDYLNYLVNNIKDNDYIKYTLAYIAKNELEIDIQEFKFNKDKQITFESIMFSGITLFKNGNGLSNSKIIETHKSFEKNLKKKNNKVNELKLGETSKLMAIKEQALKELGIDKFDSSSEQAAKILAKLAEIERRK